MIIATLLAVALQQSEGPYKLEDVLAKMRAAYSKIHSADITVVSHLGKPDKYYSTTSRTRFVAPNLIREDISPSVCTDKSMKTVPGFMFVSDGNNVQAKGRDDGKEGTWPFSAMHVQDDGAPVYKETLCLWDFDRQWSGDKGGKASGFRYQTAKPNWNGQSRIGIGEITPDHRECFQYYVDPKTYLIKRVIYYYPGDKGWQPVASYTVTKFAPNAKIDRSVFKLVRN